MTQPDFVADSISLERDSEHLSLYAIDLLACVLGENMLGVWGAQLGIRGSSIVMLLQQRLQQIIQEAPKLNSAPELSQLTQEGRPIRYQPH